MLENTFMIKIDLLKNHPVTVWRLGYNFFTIIKLSFWRMTLAICFTLSFVSHHISAMEIQKDKDLTLLQKR